MHGWLPATVQVIAAIAVIAAVGWRSRRWRCVWLPWALIVGGALAASAHWYVASQGLADNPAPHALWIWIGLSGFAAGVLVVGLARGAVVAARRLAGGGAAVPAQRRARVEPVGRLLPHRADRMESVDRRAAARPDRSGHRDRHADTAHRFRRRARWCRSVSATRHRVSGTAASWSTSRRPGTRPTRRRGCRR